MHLTRHFSHAHCTRLIMWITPHGSSVCMRASFHLHVIHDERSSVCSSLSLRSDSLRVSLLGLALLFPLLLVLWPELLLPCGQRQGYYSLCLRQPRSLAFWQNTLLPQVMSPSSLTTSTTRRLLKWSSRRNPATKIRSPRTCVTRNSTMRPSGKRYLHHCSFRREENQRTVDKLITLMKKVCCQLSHFSHTQERGDPCTNFVRAEKNQVAKLKTKQSGFSMKDKKSKFSLKSEPRSRNMNFKPILTGEVSQ